MGRRKLVAIFAHPDDEAFGPGGTLALYSKTHDVYLICVTRGEAGNNYNGGTDGLGSIREKELLASAKILGIKQVFILNHTDGTLSNGMYKNIAKDIKEITDKLKPAIFLTFDERGVSGHIDHVVVTMVTEYLFYRLDYAKTIMMFCYSEEECAALRPDYFIYVPTGYNAKNVDKVIDTSSVYEIRERAMKEHKTQMTDVLTTLKTEAKLPKQELFFIKNK